MVTVLCWSWGGKFEAVYVNRLRAMLARHLHLDHELVCVTDDPVGIDGDTRIVPLPETFRDTPRCRRRMQQYSRAFTEQLDARRVLSIDLDVVLVNDITPIIDRHEPLVCWRVGHARAYSGSFVLLDAGYLDDLWELFASDPEGFPRLVQPRGVPSDQAMLNWYLKGQPPIPFWTECDGFVTYYGKGYEKLEHLGVGPHRRVLPKGARIVVLGSADKAVMDEGHYPWVREHWTDLERVPA